MKRLVTPEGRLGYPPDSAPDLHPDLDSGRVGYSLGESDLKPREDGAGAGEAGAAAGGTCQ